MLMTRIMSLGLLLIFCLGLTIPVFTKPPEAREDNRKENIQEEKSNQWDLQKSDIDLMARTVNGEARGESFEGQVAVAAVILNRLENERFPDDVEGVVYQPWAFTAVSDGQINLAPNEASYKAVETALQGKDPSNGALFYYNPSKTTNKWIWSRPVIKQIGYHVFAR